MNKKLQEAKALREQTLRVFRAVTTELAQATERADEVLARLRERAKEAA